MKIKKYKAETLTIAIERMKMELGKDAVVLSSNVLSEDEQTGGNVFEIIAGVERSGKAHTVVQIAEPLEEKSTFEKELTELTEKVYGQKMKADIPRKAPPESAKEIDNSSLTKVREILEDKEINKEVVNAIMGQMKGYKELLNDKINDEYVMSTIGSLIPTGNFSVKKQKTPKYISFIGPTGVGKTTCVAKLAAISKLLHNLDVGIISIDTYRLGALDQLRIFSEISNIDFEVAYEAKDLQKIAAKFKKKNLVLIDTVGRSQNDKKHLAEIKSYMSQLNIDQSFLVLSTTSSSRTLQNVAKKFDTIGYDNYIFTKIDEAPAFGNILNLIYKNEKPVMFLTNGQVIPDDILAADSEFIASMIYKGEFTS